MNKTYFVCAKCDKQLEMACPSREDGDDRTAPVNDGLHFVAHGNFGSTLFDPSLSCPERNLEIVICDKCIKDLSQSGRIRMYMMDGSTTIPDFSK